jgi:hypothetical protein
MILNLIIPNLINNNQTPRQLLLPGARNAFSPNKSKSTHEIFERGRRVLDPPADLISALKLRVLGDLCFFAEAGYSSYSKNHVKDFSWWDLDGVCLPVWCSSAVVNGSLDLAARAIVLQAF